MLHVVLYYIDKLTLRVGGEGWREVGGRRIERGVGQKDRGGGREGGRRRMKGRCCYPFIYIYVHVYKTFCIIFILKRLQYNTSYLFIHQGGHIKKHVIQFLREGERQTVK